MPSYLEITCREIRDRVHRRIADQAVKRFVPFAQNALEQGLPDISTSSFQKALSCVAELPPGYLEKRELTGGTVKLSEITHKEHHEGVGFVDFPVKIMEFKDPNGHEIDVWIVLRPDRYDARIFSRELDNIIGNTYYRKLKQYSAKWSLAQPPSK